MEQYSSDNNNDINNASVKSCNNDNINSKKSYYHRRKLRYEEISQKESKSEEDIAMIQNYEEFINKRRQYNVSRGKMLRDLENKGDADAKMRIDRIRSINRRSKQNMYAAKSQRRKEIMALDVNEMTVDQRNEYYEILEERKKRNEYLKNKRLKEKKAKAEAMKEELANSLLAFQESPVFPHPATATGPTSSNVFTPL